MSGLRVVACVLVSLLACGRAFGDASNCTAAGQQLYYPCSSCHGSAGEGNEAFGAPGLRGLSEAYLVRQLRQFTTGLRGFHPNDADGAEMTLLSRTLRSDAAVHAVACYISSFAPLPQRTPTLTGNVHRGEALYAACAACHGAQACGNEALNAPSLRFSGDWYLKRQLLAYRQGWRGVNANDPVAAGMHAAAAALADENAVDDVVSYIAHLR